MINCSFICTRIFQLSPPTLTLEFVLMNSTMCEMKVIHSPRYIRGPSEYIWNTRGYIRNMHEYISNVREYIRDPRGYIRNVCEYFSKIDEYV